MSYRLCRAMKVQCADGTVELRQPGAMCPEAETWSDAGLWVKRGRIERVDGKVVNAYDRSKIKPMVSVGAEEPKQEAPATDTPEQQENRKELLTLKRGDLEDLAGEQGIKDPKSFATKDLLVTAILAEQSKLGEASE